MGAHGFSHFPSFQSVNQYRETKGFWVFQENQLQSKTYLIGVNCFFFLNPVF